MTLFSSASPAACDTPLPRHLLHFYSSFKSPWVHLSLGEDCANLTHFHLSDSTGSPLLGAPSRAPMYIYHCLSVTLISLEDDYMFAGLSRHTGASWEKLSPTFFYVSLSTVPKEKRCLTDILGLKNGLTERKNALGSNWGVSEEEKAFRLL